MKDDLVRILLVEDNPADVFLFQKALESAEWNFELTVLCDGAEAISFVRREGKYAESPVPDLAVVDFSLPKHDGAEVLEALRQSLHFPHVPVVIVSSSTSPRDRARVEYLGIERYIMKPHDLQAFLRIGPMLKQILREHNGPAA